MHVAILYILVTCILDACIVNVWVTCLLYVILVACMKHVFQSYCACAYDIIVTYMYSTHNETCSLHNWFSYTLFKPYNMLIEYSHHITDSRTCVYYSSYHLHYQQGYRQGSSEKMDAQLFLV